MSKFKKGVGDWIEYKKLGSFIEIDFHPPETDDECDYGMMPYHERMQQVVADAIRALKRAHEQGVEYVIFTHGWSTSGIGKTTSRSKVREAMKSPAATPYIVRKDCIQHNSVFVAKIRPKND